ncbi:hypothetical protein, partial [Peribacillus sp. NPDC097225]|uniref:hypothetical protein n=1 Tax=Peribacillus sp. NPDC097225 TaxID=3364400 RepID=UPI00381634C9
MKDECYNVQSNKGFKSNFTKNINDTDKERRRIFSRDSPSFPHYIVLISSGFLLTMYLMACLNTVISSSL